MRTRRADQSVTKARLAKAQQFFAAAERLRGDSGDEGQMGDACVTLLVHAGIAASDAICGSALKEYAVGESHAEAIGLLRRVRPDGDQLAESLSRLLRLKSQAGYSAGSMSAGERKVAHHAAEKLVTAARDRLVA
jgi:hypothetical protein